MEPAYLLGAYLRDQRQALRARDAIEEWQALPWYVRFWHWIWG